MTFEGVLDALTFDNITTKKALEFMETKQSRKVINSFIHRDKISKEPLKDGELSRLSAIVGILQILYNSDTGNTPVSDHDFDILQEMLVDHGIPRLTGSVEINDSKKLGHNYPQLRGTLHKIYYLRPEEKRTNKSRKYLHEWKASQEARYKKATGKEIDLDGVKVMLTPKFDGGSSCSEEDMTVGKMVWLTRGDTETNRATDVTHILGIFNDVYRRSEDCGIKYEIMCTEDNWEKINKLTKLNYRDSRQIVTATLNSKEADFKVDYLYPIPLRVIRKGETVETIHPDLISNFPTEVCTLGDVDKIREFARENKYVLKNGMRFRTDGVVITILDAKIQSALGREKNINNFEVAYKFTEESGYTKVRDVEFDPSEFGYLAPVLVVDPLILKGKKIERISLSNKERFDELFLSYGDDIKVLYDIIPYATRDEKCNRIKRPRKIPFPTHCPRCREELDLNVVEVQCHNKNCPSRLIGRILNFCSNMRIQNIGEETITALHKAGMLKNGIRSLYKLKKKYLDITDLPGFGKLKAKKIIAEIESKRRMKDYELFGSIGIETLSIASFKPIFSTIRYSEFMNMIELKNPSLLKAKLLVVSGIGDKKADVLLDYLRDPKNRKELLKLVDELSIHESYGEVKVSKGKVVFSGFRDADLRDFLESKGFEVSESLSSKTSYLIVKNKDEESTKITKATALNIPILTVAEAMKNIGGSL